MTNRKWKNNYDKKLAIKHTAKQLEVKRLSN